MDSRRLLIRPAAMADIDAMVSLLGELFAIESDFAVDPARQRRGLNLILSDERALLLVAEFDGAVVGMCSMQQLVSTAEGAAVGLVEDLVVAASHRGRGIGARLLAEVERMAKQRGLARLQLLADRDNGSALHFYEINGWQPTRLIALRRTS